MKTCTDSLINAVLVYANFTNLTFQKVTVHYLTMKFELSEIMRSGYLVLSLIGMSKETKKNLHL